MKIRTSEFVEKYEHWEYEVDELPADFENWESDDQYDWLARNCDAAHMLDSEYDGNCRVADYEVIG